MVRKVIAENLLKAVRSGLGAGQSKGNGESMDALNAREIIGALATWAGKGKDEVIQILSREVGQAVAAMLKEPLAKAIEHQKLQITLELVPRHAKKDIKMQDSKKKKAKTRSKKVEASISNVKS